jgi:hypothetical protein
VPTSLCRTTKGSLFVSDMCLRLPLEFNAAGRILVTVLGMVAEAATRYPSGPTGPNRP